MTAAEPDLLDQLIAIRKWRGLTQRQVAERIPVAQSLISFIETRRRLPRLDIVVAYARVIGAEIAVSLTQMPDPPNPPKGIRTMPGISYGTWVPTNGGAR